MTIKTRRSLLIIFVVFFVIAGIGIVYYSQGYRFDFTTFSVTKTGAINIQSTPRSVSITLNNKPYKDRSSLVHRGTFISNVLPKKYRLVIAKEGFELYEKFIDVKPAEVTRLLNILLMPDNITFTTLIEGLKGDRIVTQAQDSTLLTHDSETNTYYTCSSNALPSCTNLSSLLSTLIKQKVQSILFYPNESGTYLVYTSGGIYRANTADQEATLIIQGTTTSPSLHQQNFYVLTPADPDEEHESELIVYDLALSTQATIHKLPFEYDSIQEIVPSSDIIALMLTNKSLILFDPGKNEFEAIAHSAKLARFSPDEKKLLFQDVDGKTFIYLVQDEIATLQSTAGETLKLGLVNANNVLDIAWSDSYHLVLTYPDRVVFAEVDIIEPNNHYLITTTPAARTFFSRSSNTLYRIQEDIVSSFTLPTL